MASDYIAIQIDNQRRYGTEIGRIGPMLLSDRYDDRTHFIFELLQNAEDALSRRAGWQGSRAITFHLRDSALRISHFGKPFDERDVRGICGIAESTKDLTAIGRFGIGFKSVYAFTDRPEIHSGTEDFAVECFVRPIAVSPIAQHPDETVIVISFKAGDESCGREIAAGLRRLGPSALLFLRQIEEIGWQVEGGPTGLYLRSPAKQISDWVRQITVIGQEEGKADIEEDWIVFSKPVATVDGVAVGDVELAFSIAYDENSKCERVRPISLSQLVVFFPTVVETHLGFLVQGPYRTTPSRDNVPRHDAWNLHCMQATSNLLVQALRWLRDQHFLDTGALQCLPLDPEKFGEGSMFAPLFSSTKQALLSEPFLPSASGGHAAAKSARLARTQELRELFSGSQLGLLQGIKGEFQWLSGEISADRTPKLRQYLMRELGIIEVTPEMILLKLDASFLEAQTDAWILRLFEFLHGQPALRYRISELPWVRLKNGKHVRAQLNGQLQAFLPGKIETEFPTVRDSVCCTDPALAFLRGLGLTEPNLVDDVIWNVLPRYRAKAADVVDASYEADVRRILTAFATDSTGQREKLLAALRESYFVAAIDTAGINECLSKPGDVYLATDRFRELFAGVPGVLRVDDRRTCLRGEDVRDLLEACGVVRYLRPIEEYGLTSKEKAELRKKAGHAVTSGYKDRVTDWVLLGLKGVLDALPKFAVEERRRRARLLWEELAHLEERRGKGIFTAEYSWSHYGSYSFTLDAAFVRLLNTTEWIPDSLGVVQRPELILFDSLGWKESPFLLSKIRFKPPLIDQLAKEAGIEPGVLDLLKKLGVTSEAELRTRLRLPEDAIAGTGGKEGIPGDVEKEPPGDSPKSAPPDAAAPGSKSGLFANGGGGAGLGVSGPSSDGRKVSAGIGNSGYDDDKTKGTGQESGKRTPDSAGGRPFISYVGANADDEEPDPDGLDQAARIALEARAIDHILAKEPNWQRTPALNPGFDLFEADASGQPARWAEVKSMTGSLRDRPVGLSHTQFKCAQEHGSAYWLYIVEYAGDIRARIVRIQDPAGRARTFTFDRGWLDIVKAD
jgi:hypothetical protein